MTEILIFGEIINDTHRGIFKMFFGDDAEFTSPRTVSEALAEAKDGDVELKINSPGGHFDAGIAIGNLVKQHKGNVTANIIGLAASAASAIANQASEIVMANNAAIMTHGVQVGAPFMMDIREVRGLLEMTETRNQQLAETYAARTAKNQGENKLTVKDWINRFEEGGEQFLTAKQAKELNLIDRIGGPDDTKIVVPENYANILASMSGMEVSKRVVSNRERNLERREQEIAQRLAELEAREKNQQLMEKLQSVS